MIAEIMMLWALALVMALFLPTISETRLDAVRVRAEKRNGNLMK